MKRLHFFREHPQSINEQEKEPEEAEDQKPELTSHRQVSGDLTEYSVSLDDDPMWILKVNNKTGTVHAYQSERSIDCDSLDQLYQKWPEVAAHPDVNAAFRAMLIDDGFELTTSPGCNDQKISENKGQPNEYHEVPEEGLLKRQIAVCTPDCAEYFIKVGGSQFVFRINTETNWCRLNIRQEAREFNLEDIYDAVPELPILYRTEVNHQLRHHLEADGFVVPDTPYDLGYKVSPKD